MKRNGDVNPIACCSDEKRKMSEKLMKIKQYGDTSSQVFSLQFIIYNIGRLRSQQQRKLNASTALLHTPLM